LASWPKNKNNSLRPLSGQEHQNYSTNPTGLQVIPHDVPRGKEVGGTVPIAVFQQRKSTKKIINYCCGGGGGAFICRFSLSIEVLKPNLCLQQ